MPKLVIFDCDGVLVDSEMLATEVLSEALATAGFALSAEDALRLLVGLDAPAQRRLLETRFARPLPHDFEAGLLDRLNRAFLTRLLPLPGIETLVAGLVQPWCVASNSGHDRLTRTFAATGLSQRMAGRIFSADDVANGKPAPDLFLYAAARMGGFAASDCLVIEDSITGVTAARAAGMRVIGFCGGSHIRAGHSERLLSLGAEAIVTSHRDLAALLHPAAAHP